MKENKMTQEIKSITNDIFGKPKKSDLPKDLFHIRGVVKDFFVKTHPKFGDAIGLRGDFYVVNPETGEMLYSKAWFAPKMHATKARETLERPDSLGNIKVEGTIRAVESDSNDKGYAYILEELETEEVQDMRAELEASMKAQFANLLEAPKK